MFCVSMAPLMRMVLVKLALMSSNTTSFMYMYNIKALFCQTHASWGVACTVQSPRRDGVVLGCMHMFFFFFLVGFDEP